MLLKNANVLDRIELPSGLRGLTDAGLVEVADALRAETIAAVSVTGGHLGAGLGVVELTTALHAVFDTPRDRIVWDVGHQAYPHKILTGRRDRIRTLRKAGGLSGFTKRAESPYDPFGAAHSSTSISSALGMAVARDMLGTAEDGGDGMGRNVVAVIGDGALSAGMAYEALNNAGALGRRLVVILNDNDMSIAPPSGAMSAYLNRLKGARRSADGGRAATLFDDLGLAYRGPVDGHDMSALLAALRAARDADDPILLHVITEKGRGYPPAEARADRLHSTGPFDIATGKAPVKSGAASNAPSYTEVFAAQLMREAERDPRVVAVTAAMPSGTGLDLFGQAFPTRTFDVGIAEQHAVTFAAGLAAEGLVPFCAIYSTFLQRAYDQIVHDVALQGLPVRFAIDRAGLVGADGATHAGSFDIAYLGCLPGFVLMAAGDEADLARMVRTAALIDDRPSAFRYPRGQGPGVPVPDAVEPLEIGRGRIVREGARVAFLSYGTRLADCFLAADRLTRQGLTPTVADARFARPLDHDLLRRLARTHEAVVTVEEGSVGGFGSLVLQAMAQDGLLDGVLRVRSLVLPDRYLDHDAPAAQYAAAGLDAEGIAASALALVGVPTLRAQAS